MAAKSNAKATGPAAPAAETFGQRLIRLRTAAGFATSSDLARAIWGEKPDARGFMVAANRDTIWRFETDKSLPGKKNLQLVAEALGVTPEELDPTRAERAAKKQQDRPIATTHRQSQAPRLSNEVVSATERFLTIQMKLPADIADRAFDEIKAWWSQTGHVAEVNIVEGDSLPNPLKPRSK